MKLFGGQVYIGSTLDLLHLHYWLPEAKLDHRDVDSQHLWARKMKDLLEWMQFISKGSICSSMAVTYWPFSVRESYYNKIHLFIFMVVYQVLTTYVLGVKNIFLSSRILFVFFGLCYRGHKGMCPLNAPAFLCILLNYQSPGALTRCDMVDLLAATLMNAEPQSH